MTVDVRVVKPAGGVRNFFDLLFLRSIRAGRLRNTDWPPGLQTIVVCGTVAFFLAVAVIVASPVLRAWLPLTVTNGAGMLSLPRLLLPLFFALIIVSIALVQTAALHIRLRAAIPITLVTCLVLLFLGGTDQGDSPSDGLLAPGKLVSLLAVIALIALVALRRRRQFAWGEFAAILVLLGVTTVVALGRGAAASTAFGIDFGPSSATLIMSSLGSLAVPAAVAAGVAIAELAIIAAIAVIGALRGRADAVAGPEPAVTARRPFAALLPWVFGLLALWLVTENFVRYASGSTAAPALEEYLGALLLVALVVTGSLALARIRSAAKAGPDGPHPDSRAPISTDELMGRLNDVLLPVAGALTAVLGPIVVLLLTAQILFEWGAGADGATVAFLVIGLASTTTANTVFRVLAATAFVVFAIIAARKGKRAVPELLLAFAAIVLATGVPELFGASVDWSSEAVSVVITAATIVLAIALALQRRLHKEQLAALSIVLLLAAAAAWREVLADPLGALLGASPIAFILLGFVWGFLAGAELTRTGSEGYPVPARVLLFLANSLFGVTVLAFAAIARDLDAVIDLDKFAQVGDMLLGTALIVVASVTLWATALGAGKRSA